MYLFNSQQMCLYSNFVQKFAGEKVRLIKTFHTLRSGLLTFAHRDDQGLVTKILSCCLTSKIQKTMQSLSMHIFLKTGWVNY